MAKKIGILIFTDACSHRYILQLFFKCELREARASTQHLFFSFFFLSPDFQELWCSVVSTCLSTEVKAAIGYINTGIGDHFIALLTSLMTLLLTLVHHNLF